MAAFDAFAPRVGTAGQHAYVCSLASQAGYWSLRACLSSIYGISISKVAGLPPLDKKVASKLIDLLRAKAGVAA